jgi:ribosomal protein S18 acetylase RimI-like enzyme
MAQVTVERPVLYRAFRNTDPPRLIQVWNEAFTGRSAVKLRTATPLERFVLSKPYFDPAGLIVAEQDGQCVGFVHAGLVEGQADGVISLIAVRPSHQRRGIGRELLQRGEEYLRGRGARAIFAGAAGGHNPFYFGLYGGAVCSGFLVSDAAAEPFLLSHSYRVAQTLLVLQRPLDMSLRLVDPRFALVRNSCQIRLQTPRQLSCRAQECMVGVVEPVEFRLEDKVTGAVKCRTLMWEMDGFTNRWGVPAVGLLDYQTEASARRLGLGKYLLTTILKQLQDQYFQIVEVHIDEANEPAKSFLSQLGFDQVDVSRSYQKDQPLAA